MQAVVGCQKGVMVRGVPCVDRGNWELESQSFFVTRCLTKNVLARIAPLICSFHIQRCRSFSERVGPRLQLLEG